MTRVLLVEDNELNRDMLSRRLERRGYGVITADNGREAVDLTITERPDVILMDMDLPVLTGWEATELIKKDPAVSSIPVIGLTAHALQADKDRALRAGCDDYQSKPIDFTELVKKIDEVVLKKVDQ